MYVGPALRNSHEGQITTHSLSHPVCPLLCFAQSNEVAGSNA